MLSLPSFGHAYFACSLHGNTVDIGIRALAMLFKESPCSRPLIPDLFRGFAYPLDVPLVIKLRVSYDSLYAWSLGLLRLILHFPLNHNPSLTAC